MKDADQKDTWRVRGDDGLGPSAQDSSIDNQILVGASITKEISAVDEQASNFSIFPFLF